MNELDNHATALPEPTSMAAYRLQKGQFFHKNPFEKLLNGVWKSTVCITKNSMLIPSQNELRMINATTAVLQIQHAKTIKFEHDQQGSDLQ